MNRLLTIIYIAAAIIDYGSGYESGHCKEFGIDYEHGEEIYSKRLEIPDYCSGLFCLNSKIVYVPKYQCGRKDKVPLSTSVDFDPIKTTMSLKKRMTLQPIIPPTLGIPTPTNGCNYNGRLYKLDEKIVEGWTISQCLFTVFCDGNDRVRTEWEPGCPRTTPPTPTPVIETTLPTLTPRHGCDYNEIFMGPEGGVGNWCFASRCMPSGEIQVAHFHCLTTPGRTPATVSMAPPVIHVG